jgi:cobalamin synthase
MAKLIEEGELTLSDELILADKEIARLRAALIKVRAYLVTGAWHESDGVSNFIDAALATAPSRETTMEHIARDIREGFFPKKSPSQEG